MVLDFFPRITFRRNDVVGVGHLLGSSHALHSVYATCFRLLQFPVSLVSFITQTLLVLPFASSVTDVIFH